MAIALISTRLATILSSCVLCLFSHLIATDAPPMDQAGYDRLVQPFLKQHCIRCHGSEKQKAGISYHAFTGDMTTDDSADIWQEAIHLIEAGEMPPKKEPQPDHKSKQEVIDWLRKEIERVRQIHLQSSSNMSLRRLSNLEYKQIIQDLLQTPIDIPNEVQFIEDTRLEGFTNVTSNMDLSTLHLQQFTDAARHIVNRIFEVPEEPPTKEHWTIIVNPKDKGRLGHFTQGIHQGLHNKDLKKVKPGRIPIKTRKIDYKNRHLFSGITLQDDFRIGRIPYTMIEHTSDGPKNYEGYSDLRAYGMVGTKKKDGKSAFFGWRLFAYAEGWYKTTLRVRGERHPAFDKKHRPDQLRLTIKRKPDWTVKSSHRVTVGQSREISFQDYFPDVKTVYKNTESRYLGYELLLSYAGRTYEPKYTPQNLKGVAKSRYLKKGLPYGITIQEVEIEGPIFDAWPPPLVTSVFPEQSSHESNDAYAQRILSDFARRAWRRPLEGHEQETLLGIYESHKNKAQSVKHACKEAIFYVLASPNFFCVARERVASNSQSNKTKISAHNLAERLALFLWRSIPDEKLQSSAENENLGNPAILAEQTRRMLNDDRAQILGEDLATSWFELFKLKDIPVNKKLYGQPPKALFQQETQLVMNEIIRKNLSAFELIDSDWTYLNSWLAHHYGISDVMNEDMQRVQLLPTHGRGGVLAHASIHTLTSNGIRTSPIHRGVFVLKHILGTEPPPPAPNVPALEEAKAAGENATVRDLLAAHRDNPQCSSCHAKFDSLGLALEEYDAVGQRRTHERIIVDDKKAEGNAIDARGETTDGRVFEGLNGLKRIIKEDGDSFRRCVIQKLLTYALDRKPNFVDEPLIQSLISTMRANDDRMQDLIIAIVTSESFQTP